MLRGIADLLTAFSVGVESFSIMVSAIIYYCYMQDPDSAETHTALFAQLLVADTVGLFFCMEYLGKPRETNSEV